LNGFVASRLPRSTGPAGWNRLLPPLPQAVPLSGNVTADVAIVGAGFAGLSAARRLAKNAPGASIAVLEAGRVAEGPAGRNSGFMIDLPHDLASDDYAGGSADSDRRQTAANRLAIAFGAELAEEYGFDSSTFDPSGKLNAASTPGGDRANDDYASHLARLGEPYECLDAQAMLERTGTRWYTSGVHTPGTVMLQPAAYVRGLADALRRTTGARLSIHENSPVREMVREGACWRLKSDGGGVSAARVILAVNGHAESFGFFRRQLIHVVTFASMTARFPREALPGQSVWGATPSDPMGTTVRRIEEGGGSRIVVRTRFVNDPGLGGAEASAERTWRLHDKRFLERFPTLAGIDMPLRWGGHLCLSRNGVAAHGEIEPGLFAAVCQNGLGTTRGTLAGMSAADLVTGIESEATRAMLGEAPPQPLPPEPFASVGIGAALAWKQWRAGRE